MDDLGLSMDELSELARMALAAMDSEPVIIVGDDGGDALSYRRLIQSFAPGTKLYRHAQPAPVLPEEATPDSIEILASARRRDHAVFQWDEDQRNAAADSWNAFRAAMLQELKKSAGTEAICRSDENVQVLHTKSPAQSDCCPAQNSVTPAQNQGWIPVSERMPENDGAYLCWDNRYVTTYAFIFGAWQANQFIAKNITHWMPLPAGPQEVR
ncbi:Eaa1 [Klebsiella pneumoniae]|nr:Eaa1 [Klebsiella pneumoniae]